MRSHDVLSHDENLSHWVTCGVMMNYVRKGMGMVKWDIRIVFHKVRFCKMSQTDPVLNAKRAPGMHLLQNPGPELSGTTDEQRN